VSDLDGEAIRRVPVVETAERIDRRLEVAETMMMGLRLDTGVGVEEFAGRFGVAPSDVYGDDLRELESAGLLDTADGRVRLTGRGRLLGNEVFSRFFDYTAATA
jgi:oxygen-independent coproporphyrinogen-3 oxidase